MTLLLDLVNTSQRVGATAARLAKVRELATFLRSLPQEEIDTAVHYLSDKRAADADNMDSVRKIFAAQAGT
jgi:hypothetical protein